MRFLVRFSLVIAALSGGFTAAEPVNFKISTLIDSSHEGPDRPRSYITVGPRRISFAEPQFCQVSSSPDSLTVYLAKPGQSGQFTVTNSSFKPDVDFVARTEDYFKAGEGTIPKEAEGTEFKGADSSLYVINKWKSIAFDWTYTMYGHATCRQVAYINIDPEHQICLTILCNEESAQATFGTALRFIKSWYWAEELNGTYK